MEMRKLFVTMASFSEGFTSVTAGSAAAKESGAKTQKMSAIAIANKTLFIALSSLLFSSVQSRVYRLLSVYSIVITAVLRRV
jgi:hypothetical protein